MAPQHLGLLALVWAACTIPTTGVLAAELTNGNFADGFDGWSGELFPEDPGVPVVDVSDLDADSRFSVLFGGEAEISTDLTDPDVIVQTTLYQRFSIPTDAVGIEFSYGWDFGTTDDPSVSATLDWNPDDINFGGQFLDLLDAAGVDPFDPQASGLASILFSDLPSDQDPSGADVVMAFSVFAGGIDNDDDSARFGNVKVLKAVPAPAPLALIALGLLWLRFGPTNSSGVLAR